MIFGKVYRRIYFLMILLLLYNCVVIEGEVSWYLFLSMVLYDVELYIWSL